MRTKQEILEEMRQELKKIAWEAVNERDVMGTPIVLTMKFSPQNGVWILLDAEEKDVGRLSDWVAKALGGEDYSGKTEYMVVIEPGEING